MRTTVSAGVCRWRRAITDPPLILHLATHGFFLDARAEGAARSLTLAGLALAGANLGLKGDLGPGGQDGLLYALEAQDLNLEGTRLVVLSACDTGRAGRWTRPRGSMAWCGASRPPGPDRC
ncbi:MAG: CHAT domain-containing protein [Lamprocystis purpurea]|jgi:CHAT domain-containing protein|uniref:CHAT domain-containing protein n=1 Tax=Lamprocystis purpurea TaxID=61598 RepID=UPI000477C243|nr:CHAT domain-containing protein [Lamprocystis purpurea]MBV5273075.1 CHAT domain-containing protein [Lamprocystis purpurea]